MTQKALAGEDRGALLKNLTDYELQSTSYLPENQSPLYGLLSMAETLYGKQCRAAPNCAMAVALARLFYMVQGITPMTDSAKPRTLKDQLESETADMERSAAVDSER